jgi:hypothetical protein
MNVKAEATTTQNKTSIGWKSVGVSLRGTSHDKKGEPCQDAHYLMILDNQWLIIGVSDGAGSAKHSEIGSQVASKCAVQTMASLLKEKSPTNEQSWKELFTRVFDITLGVVLNKADELGYPKREVACTLILSVLGPKATVTGHIGDGAVVIQDEKGNVQTFSRPTNGENINETTFLVSSNAVSSLQFTYLDKKVVSIGSFTDGIQLIALYYPSWDPAPQFFLPVFRFMEDEKDFERAKVRLTDFLSSDKIRSNSDDDITLVLARNVMTDTEIKGIQEVTRRGTSNRQRIGLMKTIYYKLLNLRT